MGQPTSPSLTSQPAAFTLGPAWELTGAASSRADLAGRWEVEGTEPWGHPFPSSSWPAPRPESRPRALEGQNKAEFQSEHSPGSSHLIRGGSRVLTAKAHLPLPAVRGGWGLTLREPAQPLAFPGFPHALPLPPQEMAGKHVSRLPGQLCEKIDAHVVLMFPDSLCGRLSPALINPCVLSWAEGPPYRSRPCSPLPGRPQGGVSQAARADPSLRKGWGWGALGHRLGLRVRAEGVLQGLPPRQSPRSPAPKTRY